MPRLGRRLTLLAADVTSSSTSPRRDFAATRRTAQRTQVILQQWVSAIKPFPPPSRSASGRPARCHRGSAARLPKNRLAHPDVSGFLKQVRGVRRLQVPPALRVARIHSRFARKKIQARAPRKRNPCLGGRERLWPGLNPPAKGLRPKPGLLFSNPSLGGRDSSSALHDEEAFVPPRVPARRRSPAPREKRRLTSSRDDGYYPFQARAAFQQPKPGREKTLPGAVRPVLFPFTVRTIPLAEDAFPLLQDSRLALSYRTSATGLFEVASRTGSPSTVSSRATGTISGDAIPVTSMIAK